MGDTKKEKKAVLEEEQAQVQQEGVEETQAEEVEESQEAQLLKQVETLEEALKEEKDKALRALAELENYKRRKNQELESFKQYANEKVVVEFLPIVDNFERALESVNEKEPTADFVEGVRMILKQYHDVLSKLGVSKIEALNETFDPNMHQAISQESVDGVASNTVTQVMQNGYKLKDRVVRPSLVVVSM